MPQLLAQSSLNRPARNGHQGQSSSSRSPVATSSRKTCASRQHSPLQHLPAPFPSSKPSPPWAPGHVCNASIYGREIFEEATVDEQAVEEHQEMEEQAGALPVVRPPTNPVAKPPVPPLVDADPEVTLVTKMKAAAQDDESKKQQFWGDFMQKCRLAWDIFFPKEPEVMSPAGAVKSRLHMILVSDRCGLDLPTLMKIKQSSMAAIALDNGWDAVTELQVQVASYKANGDRITMSLPLTSIPEPAELRDPREYHYQYYDDDDYFEEDDGHVSEILESSGQYSTALSGLTHGELADSQEEEEEEEGKPGEVLSEVGSSASSSSNASSN